MTLTVTAGTPATASQFNSLIPKYLLQGSDQTLNTVTMTDSNTFAGISVGAGEVWEFTFNLVSGDSTAASDMKTDFAVTGTVTTGYRHIMSMGVTSTVSADMPNTNMQCRTTTTDVSHGVTSSSSVFSTVQEKLIVNGGISGGTITHRWACVAASGNVTVKAGSHMIAHRVT